MLKPTYWLMGIFLVAAIWNTAAGEETSGETPPYPPQAESLPQTPTPVSPLRSPAGPETAYLAPLRHLHEGFFFLYRRYAMLEALISAEDRVRSENQAFWIGAASWVPGAGQMINGDTLQGSLLLIASGLSAATVRHLEFTRRQLPGGSDWLPWYYAALTLRNGVISYSMLHAANAAYRGRRDRTAAMWTGAASVIPGVGQAINGDWWEAAGFFSAYVLSAAVSLQFEKCIYPAGNDPSYLAGRGRDPQVNLAWLPGGAMVSITAEW